MHQTETLPRRAARGLLVNAPPSARRRKRPRKLRAGYTRHSGITPARRTHNGALRRPAPRPLDLGEYKRVPAVKVKARRAWRRALAGASRMAHNAWRAVRGASTKGR